MKHKKIGIVITIVVILLLLSSILIFIFGSKNITKFQSKSKMSEVIDGTWRTGDTEFDFILTIHGNMMDISMDNKNTEGASEIVLVPKKGYFYYIHEGDKKDSRYNVIYENGTYIIKDNKWTYRKVK